MIIDKSTTEVLIVGAGPTGLAMANELARHGVSFRIIDKLHQASERSKALVVHARTLELLRLHDLDKKFTDLGIVIRNICIYDLDKELVKLSLQEIDSSFPYALGLPQFNTEQIFAENLLNKYQISVERNCELIELEQTKTGIKSKIKNANGIVSEIHSQYLVACDGSHSTVRHILKEEFLGGEYQETFKLADIKIDWKNWKESVSSDLLVFHGKKVIAAFFPLPYDKWRVVIILASDEINDGLEQEPSLDEIQTYVNDACPWQPTLSDADWLANFKVRYRKIKQYRCGRIFFAGDSAHIHSPVGGQGMNTGIQDAFNLAWKLALVVKEKAGEELLNSYHEERNAVAEQLLKSVDMLTRVNLTRGNIARTIRNHIAPLIISQKPVQQKLRNFLSELEISYRKSSIVYEAETNFVDALIKTKKDCFANIKDDVVFQKGPQAGDRAPDAQLIDPVSRVELCLNNLFKSNKHTLLLFTGDSFDQNGGLKILEYMNLINSKYSAFIQSNLITLPREDESKFLYIENKGKIIGKVYFDLDFLSHRCYGAALPLAYLIRPDTYIGFRSQNFDIKQIDDYFSKILS